MAAIAVIIVTHNAEAVLGHCIDALKQSQQPCTICIVDSGSDDPDYLLPFARRQDIKVILRENIGFSKANNVGYQQVAGQADYIVFLNPDAFVFPETFTLALRALAEKPQAGCLTGRLLSYDMDTGQATGRLDSTGIFRAWYGRWQDRGQGELDQGQYTEVENIPAACAAFLFCRKTVLEEVSSGPGIIFDPDFFLYKEDIELCLRIRQAAWKIVYLPEIKVFHCRGWQQRKTIAHSLRLTAAAGELLLYRKHPSPYIVWALIKYMLVRFFKV